MDIITQDVKKDVENELFKSMSTNSISGMTTSSDEEIPDVVLQLRSEFNAIYGALEEQRSAITQIMVNLKKYHLKAEKKLVKKVNKERKKGITKPCFLSDSLCDFLEIDHGSQMSRTEVTKQINEYIRSSDLFFKGDRRYFVVDKVLSDLLNVELNEKISFFSIQQKMNSHFKYGETNNTC